MANLGIVRIPANLEALKNAIGPERLSHVLIECAPDLRAVKQGIAEVASAGQGKLLFIKGRPGQGKTTLAESTSLFLADTVGGVVTPPAEFALPLKELPGWLHTNLPKARAAAGSKFVIVNLDGREIPTTDETATQAAMGNLNGLLRREPKLLALWPVNDEGFAKGAIDRLTLAGGKSALVNNPIHALVGLEKNQYEQALNLVLAATDVTLADAAISGDEVRGQIAGAETVGDFLRSVQRLVVSRYDLGELGLSLPRLYIIITANDDTYDECRLLRRGTRFLVDPDKLLQFSRANVSTDWKARGKENPRKGLPFVSALFEVRLLNLSSSAVVNACAFGPDEDLRKAILKHYNAKVSANAANAMKNSALSRALRGEEDVGLAKSNPTQPVKEAFKAIQKMTNGKHREINASIVNVLLDLNIPLPELEYEYLPFDDPNLELRCDVKFKRDERPETLEFTHRADGDASVAVIASYVLQKVEDYARDYGLLG